MLEDERNNVYYPIAVCIHTRQRNKLHIDLKSAKWREKMGKCTFFKGEIHAKMTKTCVNGGTRRAMVKVTLSCLPSMAGRRDIRWKFSCLHAPTTSADLIWIRKTHWKLREGKVGHSWAGTAKLVLGQGACLRLNMSTIVGCGFFRTSPEIATVQLQWWSKCLGMRPMTDARLTPCDAMAADQWSSQKDLYANAFVHVELTRWSAICSYSAKGALKTYSTQPTIKERGEEAHVRSAVQGLPHTSSPVSSSRSSCLASTSLSFSIWFDVFTTS